MTDPSGAHRSQSDDTEPWAELNPYTSNASAASVAALSFDDDADVEATTDDVNSTDMDASALASYLRSQTSSSSNSLFD